MDEKEQFIKKQNSGLEKLLNDLDATKMEILSLKEQKDGLKQKIRGLQIEMKKMMNPGRKKMEKNVLYVVNFCHLGDVVNSSIVCNII